MDGGGLQLCFQHDTHNCHSPVINHNALQALDVGSRASKFPLGLTVKVHCLGMPTSELMNPVINPHVTQCLHTKTKNQ